MPDGAVLLFVSRPTRRAVPTSEDVELLDLDVQSSGYRGEELRDLQSARLFECLLRRYPDPAVLLSQAKRTLATRVGLSDDELRQKNRYLEALKLDDEIGDHGAVPRRSAFPGRPAIGDRVDS